VFPRVPFAGVFIFFLSSSFSSLLTSVHLQNSDGSSRPTRISLISMLWTHHCKDGMNISLGSSRLYLTFPPPVCFVSFLRHLGVRRSTHESYSAVRSITSPGDDRGDIHFMVGTAPFKESPCQSNRCFCTFEDAKGNRCRNVSPLVCCQRQAGEIFVGGNQPSFPTFSFCCPHEMDARWLLSNRRDRSPYERVDCWIELPRTGANEGIPFDVLHSGSPPVGQI